MAQVAPPTQPPAKPPVQQPPAPKPAAPKPAARQDSSVVRRRPAAIAARPQAPLSPKRAFLTSAALPGLGQSKLDRGSSGALFAAVELAAVVMLRRSNADYHEAKRFQLDTIPTDFALGSNGKPVKLGSTATGYTADLVRTRRLHREDWIAVIAFNHLFSGADAFVAAQLWDMPVQMSAVPTARGAAVVATLRF